MASFLKYCLKRLVKTIKKVSEKASACGLPENASWPLYNKNYKSFGNEKRNCFFSSSFYGVNVSEILFRCYGRYCSSRPLLLRATFTGCCKNHTPSVRWFLLHPMSVAWRSLHEINQRRCGSG